MTQNFLLPFLVYYTCMSRALETVSSQQILNVAFMEAEHNIIQPASLLFLLIHLSPRAIVSNSGLVQVLLIIIGLINLLLLRQKTSLAICKIFLF